MAIGGSLPDWKPELVAAGSIQARLHVQSQCIDNWPWRTNGTTPQHEPRLERMCGKKRAASTIDVALHSSHPTPPRQRKAAPASQESHTNQGSWKRAAKQASKQKEASGETPPICAS